MNSFISWVGGKRLLRNKVIEIFPQNGCNRYIEVFGGAAWVLFAKDKHAAMEVYNDTNSNLVNLFKCAKFHPEALQKELEYTLTSREQFFDAKRQMDIEGLTDIQKAAKFFILIKESFASDLHSFCIRPKNMENAVEYILEVSKRLRNVVIENQDFERILNTYDNKDALFYLDPPYYKAEHYYQAKFADEDHVRLKSVIGGGKG